MVVAWLIEGKITEVIYIHERASALELLQC